MTSSFTHSFPLPEGNSFPISTKTTPFSRLSVLTTERMNKFIFNSCLNEQPIDADNHSPQLCFRPQLPLVTEKRMTPMLETSDPHVILTAAF